MINLIGDLLIVEPDTASTGPIRLPDWKRSLSGRVLSIGPDVKSVYCGSRVSFGAAVGMDAIWNSTDVRILKEDDLDFVYEA